MIKMSYEELVQVFETEKKINLPEFLATIENMIGDYDDYEGIYEEYSENNRSRLRNLAKLLTDDTVKVFGTADHYHNIAVTYAREEMNDSACDILLRGIENIPYAVDLIADYIRYGILSGQIWQCDTMYLRLLDISKSRWNWRAYSFSIDYLLGKCNYVGTDTELNKIKQEVLKLADMFINVEKSDQAYFDKAVVYRVFGEQENEYITLEEGFNQLKSAPKCALRLADISFEHGNFDEAISKLKHCCNRLKPQPDIRGEYAYLLLALSKTSELFDKEEPYQDKKSEVNSIYRDFHSALSSGLLGVYKDTANTAIRILVSQTDIEYPYDDSDTGSSYDF